MLQSCYWSCQPHECECECSHLMYALWAVCSCCCRAMRHGRARKPPQKLPPGFEPLAVCKTLASKSKRDMQLFEYRSVRYWSKEINGTRTGGRKRKFFNSRPRAPCGLWRPRRWNPVNCPVPLTVRGTQTLVSFAPLAFKLFCAARQNAVLRRSPFPPV